MIIELRKAGLGVAEEVSIPVYYDGQLISEYIADWVVEDKIIRSSVKSVQTQYFANPQNIGLHTFHR